ncbi:MAG: hypothetical protein ACLFM1_10065 [Bacteroidales bacterium]
MNKNEPDKYLIRGLKKGKLHCLEQMFRKYYAGLFQFLVIKGTDPKQAEEEIIALFLHMWTKRRKILLKDALPAYLLTSLKSRVNSNSNTEPANVFSADHKAPADTDKAWKKLQKMAKSSPKQGMPYNKKVILLTAAVVTLLLVLLIIYQEFIA